MLEEYMAFNGRTMPPLEKPIYKWNIKLNKSMNKSIYSKFSKFSMESLEESIEQELTLAEKIMQRQQEEKQKLEEKKRKILKELHKKKRINLKKFLTRETGYEQKRIYNIEQKRFKELEEENKNFKDKPLLSSRTLELIKTKKIKPTYLKSRQIIENKQKNIENDNNNSKLNKSMDSISINKYTDIKKRVSKKDAVNYYIKQNKWKNKIKEKIDRNDMKRKKINLDIFFILN